MRTHSYFRGYFIGLIPVVTHECGFSNMKGIINLKLCKDNYNLNLLNNLQKLK